MTRSQFESDRFDHVTILDSKADSSRGDVLRRMPPIVVTVNVAFLPKYVKGLIGMIAVIVQSYFPRKDLGLTL